MARRKKNAEPEYRLRIFPHLTDRHPVPGIAVSIETIKEFVSFEYEVVLEEHHSEEEFSFKILGLHAPQSVMPAVGPARGVRVFERIKNGNYRFRISKPDGGENTFLIRVGKAQIELVQAPEQPFVVFTNEPIPLPD